MTLTIGKLIKSG